MWIWKKTQPKLTEKLNKMFVNMGGLHDDTQQAADDHTDIRTWNTENSRVVI